MVAAVVARRSGAAVVAVLVARRSGAAVVAPVDAELAHPRAQRVRVDRELARRTERAVDPALARDERALDVTANHVIERLDGSGRARRSG
jgi:hypothetical protein